MIENSTTKVDNINNDPTFSNPENLENIEKESE